MDERLLVPIDDSEPSRAAIEEAITLFDPREIILLHVVELDAMTHGAAGAAAEGLHEERENQAQELFDDARRSIEGTGVAVESSNADHIVMGSHGRSGLSGVLVGSVAKNVIKHSPVSVTISRP